MVEAKTYTQKEIDDAMKWEPTEGHRERPQKYWDILMSLEYTAEEK